MQHVVHGFESQKVYWRLDVTHVARVGWWVTKTNTRIALCREKSPNSLQMRTRSLLSILTQHPLTLLNSAYLWWKRMGHQICIIMTRAGLSCPCIREEPWPIREKKCFSGGAVGLGNHAQLHDSADHCSWWNNFASAIYNITRGKRVFGPKVRKEVDEMKLIYENMYIMALNPEN